MPAKAKRGTRTQKNQSGKKPVKTAGAFVRGLEKKKRNTA